MQMQRQPYAIAPFERVAIFIEGSNTYASLKRIGADTEWHSLLAFYVRLVEYLSRNSILIRAFYYTGVCDDPKFQWVKDLCRALELNGITVRTKPVRGRGTSMKGDTDMELAIDMLTLAERIDRAILVSGDGDFEPLVEAVKMKGVRFQVVSSLKTSPESSEHRHPVLSDTLRRKADLCTLLEDIFEDVQKLGRPFSYR